MLPFPAPSRRRRPAAAVVRGEEDAMEARCPSCGSGLLELSEDQWPAEGPVPAGTIAVFQCDEDHRVTVGKTQIQA